MQLTQLDTRVPLSVESPQINFNQLTADTLGLYDNIQQRGQQGILSRLLAQNTNAQGEVDLNSALASARNQPYAPQLVGSLSSAIQAQNAARTKAQQDALKFDADVNKIYAETGKLSQESTAKGLENSEKRLGAINQVFQMASLTGSKADVLLGLENAHKVGMIGDEEFFANKQAVKVMNPEEVMQFAQGISFSNAKDPASYLFQTKDNEATNATSAANNVRTTQASMYGDDLVAQTAANKLAQEGQQFNQNFALNQQRVFFEQNKPIGFEVGNDGFKYAIYPNGKGVRVLGDDGQPIKVQKTGAMNSTIQGAILETDDKVSSTKNAITNLKDALEYSKKAYDGIGAVQRATARGLFGEDERATATTMLDNIVTGNALEMLKATFGAAPTEGERAILLQLQGSANLPRTQREAIYTRGIQMAEARLVSNQQKAADLRSGTYFSQQSRGTPHANTDQSLLQRHVFNLFD